MTTISIFNLSSALKEPILNKRFTCQPENAALKHQCANVSLTALKVGSIVAFIIGAIGGAVALVSSGTDFNGVLMYATGFATGFQFVDLATSWLGDHSGHHAMAADKCKRIAQIASNLHSLNEDELSWTFLDHGISVYGIDDFEKVKGGLKALQLGLAHFLYTKETTVALEEAIEKAKEDDSDPIQSKKRQFVYKQAAAISRLHAAHDLYLILHPFSDKSLSTIGKFTDRDIEQIRLDRQDGKDESMFFFKTEAKDLITFDDLCNRSLDSLSSLL